MGIMPNHNWNYVSFCEAVDICDTLRKPINSKERSKRIAGKKQSELYPYYGATGQVGYIDDYITDGEYVLLGEDGAPFLDAFAPKAYVINGKAWVNNHAHVLRSKKSNKFLCYYLNYFNYKGFVSGTTRLKLTQSSMKQIEIPDPTLSEQERIVARIEELFSQLDSGMETLKKVKQQLTVYRQAALKEAFSYNENNVKVSSICDVVRGGSPRPAGDERYYNGNIPFLKVADLTNSADMYLNSYTYTIKEAGLKKTRRVPANTLLLSNSGATLGVPKICTFETTFNDGIAAFLNLNPEKEYLPYHYYFWMSMLPEMRAIDQGAAQPNLNTTIIGDVDIPHYDIQKQRQIAEWIETRVSVCGNIEQTVDVALHQAEAMRQSILKKAFEGRL